MVRGNISKNFKEKKIEKYSSFKTNRTFFIEQLLGILQFTIKKGLKKKLKRSLNILLSKLFIKDNKLLEKFNKKLVQYKQPYKTMTKRKKKWRRRLFSTKQRELRVTPFLKNNYFSQKFKRLTRRRPKNYLIFLNSKEQMHEIKKIYIDLVKQNKTSKFETTVEKQIKFFLSLKSLKLEKKIGWIKFLVRQYLKKDKLNWKLKTLLKKESELPYFKRFFFIKRIKFLFNKKKYTKSFNFYKFKKTIKNKQKYLKTNKYKKKIYKTNFLTYKKFIFKNKELLKKDTNNITSQKRFYSTTKQSKKLYEINFFSSEKQTLIKIKKYAKYFFMNNLNKDLTILPIKKETKRITVLKSPHVNKTARSQYEQNNYNLCIQIKDDLVSKKIIFNLIFRLKSYFSFVDFSFKLKVI